MSDAPAQPRPQPQPLRVRPGRIFLALALGLGVGTVLAESGSRALEPVLEVARTVGRLWLNGLTMTVVPLVFGLLVVGVANASNAAAAGRVARRAMVWFAVLLIAGCVTSAAVSIAVLAAWPVMASASLLGGGAPESLPPVADWLLGIVPANAIKAAADMAMLPLVVFALLFGAALTRIEAPLRDSLVTVFRAIVDTMLVIVSWVLWLAPLGVFALAISVGAVLGAGAVGTLLQYVIVVALGCLSAALLSAATAVVAGRLPPLTFARAALPPQTVAVSTQSSLASLPAMIEAAPGLGVTVQTAGVVLPLAVTLFRAASAAANIAVGIYLAHLHGIALTPEMLIAGVLTAVAVSLAAVGLPAQVNFFSTIAPVCLAMGVPITLLPVLLAVETVPDIFRTLGNVTADLAVTRLAGRTRRDER